MILEDKYFRTPGDGQRNPMVVIEIIRCVMKSENARKSIVNLFA